jgi:hypothetical protein
VPDQPWRSIMLQAVTWARGGTARHMSDFTAAQRPSATVTKRPQRAAGSVTAARRHIRITARLVRRISRQLCWLRFFSGAGSEQPIDVLALAAVETRA